MMSLSKTIGLLATLTLSLFITSTIAFAADYTPKGHCQKFKESFDKAAKGEPRTFAVSEDGISCGSCAWHKFIQFGNNCKDAGKSPETPAKAKQAALKECEDNAFRRNNRPMKCKLVVCVGCDTLAVATSTVSSAEIKAVQAECRPNSHTDNHYDCACILDEFKKERLADPKTHYNTLLHKIGRTRCFDKNKIKAYYAGRKCDEINRSNAALKYPLVDCTCYSEKMAEGIVYQKPAKHSRIGKISVAAMKACQQ